MPALTERSLGWWPQRAGQVRYVPGCLTPPLEMPRSGGGTSVRLLPKLLPDSFLGATLVIDLAARRT